LRKGGRPGLKRLLKNAGISPRLRCGRFFATRYTGFGSVLFISAEPCGPEQRHYSLNLLRVN
jgi:hypothetical protein